MQQKGWQQAAALMKKWFSRPASVKPNYSQPPDLDTVKMEWLLKTSSVARNVYDNLVRDKIWANRPAQQAIAAQLRRKGVLLRGGRFGNLDLSVDKLHPDHINHRPVDYPNFSSDPDGVFAAFHDFAFYVTVGGEVAPIENTSAWRVSITEIGVYAMDSFDFEGVQPLGWWDDSNDSFSVHPFHPDPSSSFELITNRSFRNWRSEKKKGGDFLVFSDLKFISLAVPNTFEIQ